MVVALLIMLWFDVDGCWLVDWRLTAVLIWFIVTVTPLLFDFFLCVCLFVVDCYLLRV